MEGIIDEKCRAGYKGRNVIDIGYRPFLLFNAMYRNIIVKNLTIYTNTIHLDSLCVLVMSLNLWVLDYKIKRCLLENENDKWMSR